MPLNAYELMASQVGLRGPGRRRGGSNHARVLFKEKQRESEDQPSHEALDGGNLSNRLVVSTYQQGW